LHLWRDAGNDVGRPGRPMRRALRPVAAVALALLCASAPGCTRLITTPRPAGVGTIAVLPVENRTGSELYADAPPLLLAVLSDAAEPPRVTVGDLLVAEARRRLAAQGFVVVDAARVLPPGARSPGSAADAAEALRRAGGDAAVLYLTLARWDPDQASRPTYVDVELDMVLLDGRSAQPIWRAHLPAQPVDGDGTGTISLAYPAVARTVVARMLAGLAPSPP
jgi:hypothetical protein